MTIIILRLYDLCTQKQSIILIFREEIHYFRHDQAGGDCMMQDSQAAHKNYYSYTVAFLYRNKSQHLSYIIIYYRLQGLP